MKKAYVTPRIACEEFQANEYVAACGDSGTVYKFTCDAGYIETQKSHSWGNCGCGTSHWTNVPSGTYLQRTKGDWYVYDDKGNRIMPGHTYSPCGIQHEAESDGTFIRGYIDNPYTDTNEDIDVMIWRGENNDNIHCTTNLDQDSWETAKS